MKIVDAIAEILKREGVEFLSAYPTTPVIDAAAAAGIRPVLCRQERVGVGIADGYSRTTNGRRLGVFAMQYGPGAENAFPGVATAYSDSVPMLVLPLGHQRDRAQVFPALQLGAHLRLGDEVGGDAEPAGAGRRGHAARVQPAQDGAPGAGHGRDPGRRGRGGGGRQAALHYKPVKATCPLGQSRATSRPPRGPSSRRSGP